MFLFNFLCVISCVAVSSHLDNANLSDQIYHQSSYVGKRRHKLSWNHHQKKLYETNCVADIDVITSSFCQCQEFEYPDFARAVTRKLKNKIFSIRIKIHSP